jgi:hypothetical protein
LTIGTRVATAQGNGVIVAGTMWTANENDPGDRVVEMDGTGERLVFEPFLMVALPYTWARIEGDATRIVPIQADALVNEMCAINVWTLISSSVRKGGQYVITVYNGSRYIEVTRVQEGTTLV